MNSSDTSRSPVDSVGALDFGDPALYATTGRYAMWESLAAGDHVVWTERGSSPSGFWSVFSHSACSAVLAPQAAFTSEYGMMIGFDAQHADRAGGRMLVVTDGARHTALRRVIGPYLSRAKAASLYSFIESETRSLLMRERDKPVIDIAVSIGPFIPAASVCEILGVPPADREFLIRLTSQAFGDSGSGEMTPSEAHAEILLYFDYLVAERRRHPREDVISALLQDSELTPDDVLMNCDNVLIGGNETTRHAIVGAFHAAAEEPGFLSALAADIGRTDAGVEEIIRWTSPAMNVLRVATSDVKIAGQAIEKGTPVVACLPAANRDRRVFDNPHRFNFSRQMNRHLGFGVGAHHCLGAAFARMELSIVIRLMAEAMALVELDEEPEWMRSNTIQGYRNLKVNVTWKDRRAA